MSFSLTLRPKIFLLAMFGMVAWEPSFIKAEAVEERLWISQTTTREWLAVFDADRAILLRAKTRREGELLILTADLADKLSPQALVGAVVELLDGQILSNALHRPGEVLIMSGAALSAAELGELEKRILATKARITEVESQIETAQVALRRKAGLEDVAQNLERISDLRKKIKKMKNIQQLLEKAKGLVTAS